MKFFNVSNFNNSLVKFDSKWQLCWQLWKMNSNKIKFCSIFSKLLSIIKKFHLSIHQKNATNREAQKSATLPNIFLSCFIALYANITATRLSFHVLPQSEPSWKLQFDWLIIGLFRRWHEIFIMLRVKEILEIDPMEIAETQWKFHWEFRNWNEVALDVIPLNCNEFFFLSGLSQLSSF